jgi:hypothetical protein
MNAPMLLGAPGGNFGGGEAAARRRFASPKVGLLVEATNARK